MNLENFKITYYLDNPEKFSKELNILKERLYYKFFPIKSFFSMQEIVCIEAYNKAINQYKTQISNLPKIFREKILEEISNIDCKATDGRKIKYFTEQIISDNAIDSIKIFFNLKKYYTYVNNLKSQKDEGIKNFLIFEYGDKYKSTHEFRNIIMFNDLTKNALELLCKSNISKETNNTLKNVVCKLKQIIPFEVDYYEYGTADIKKLDNITQEDFDVLDNLNKSLKNANTCKNQKEI